MTSPNIRIDLRSDTVTKPTEAMRRAMAEAEVGDDGYQDDPSVNALEALAAEMLGKEAALYVPSGTMGNLVCLLAHTGRGCEVLLEESAHILRAEMGGIASVAGLFHRPVPGRRGAMDLDRQREFIRPNMTPRSLGTGLVCMENTHNAGGGAVLPLDHMAAVAEIAHKNGVPVHTDGARIFNAAHHLGVPARDLAQHTDSLSFCLSKGLSAPVGSVVVGTQEFIQRARTMRRSVGGMLRQVGVLAAAGIVALREMVDRLPEDHATARRLAERLHAVDPALADPDLTETNIVQVHVGGSKRPAQAWVDDLKTRGVLAGAPRPTMIRMVTNRHVSESDVDQAAEIFGEVWGRA